LADEHVVPFSLGGVHVLDDASCARCAEITSAFERKVARDLWGDARTSYNAPSRRKKKRDKHIGMPDGSAGQIPIAATEFPGVLVFPKMNACGFLQGLPETVDLSPAWTFVAVDDDARRNAFFQKYGKHATHTFRFDGYAFGRLLAKIAHCQLLTELDPGDFNPMCLPYILGKKGNVSYIVGGSVEGRAPESVGYRLSTLHIDAVEKILLVVDIRLYANTHAPIYRVVGGEAVGPDQTERVRATFALTS
jgi:hypothetical protein